MKKKRADTAVLLENKLLRISVRGKKSFKQNQENNLVTIPDEEIEKYATELISKFDPPFCINCEQRKADRVCINKACGPKNYMQVICGKCHSDAHSKAIKKPEIDIEEYFIKLAQFLDKNKYSEKKGTLGYADKEQLATAFDDLQGLKNKLFALKSKLQYEIENTIFPQDMQSGTQDCITKAFSFYEQDTFSKQLREIQKRIIFTSNHFQWNDANQKYESFYTHFKELKEQTSNASKTITRSFFSEYQIDLNKLELVASKGLCYGMEIGKSYNSKPKDDMLTLKGFHIATGQAYLNHDLDSTKKYRVRFRFGPNPCYYIMIGIMPKSLVDSQWVYNIKNEFFCKRFFSNIPDKECSWIVKGKELSKYPKSGYEIDMQFDIENNYMHFADYPEYKNINANYQHHKVNPSQIYVIAITMANDQTVSIIKFEEISQIYTH